LCDGVCILTDAWRPLPILPPQNTHNPQVLSNPLVRQIAQLSDDQYVVLKTSTALVPVCILLDMTSGLLLNRPCVLLDIIPGRFGIVPIHTHHVTYVATQQPTNIYQSAHAHDRETREKQERETRDQEIKRYKAYIYT
jgi:hypothetical protein